MSYWVCTFLYKIVRNVLTGKRKLFGYFIYLFGCYLLNYQENRLLVYYNLFLLSTFSFEKKSAVKLFSLVDYCTTSVLPNINIKTEL